MIDAAWILRSSRRAAAKHVPPPYRHWVEDIAAETALIMLRRAQRGQHGAGIWHRRAVLMAVHRYFGLPGTQRNEGARFVDLDEGRHLTEPARIEERALSLARLQRIWPELTDREREAVTLYLGDHNAPESARKMGVTKTQVCRLRKSVQRQARGEARQEQVRHFTAGQLLEVREMRARGLTVATIAEHFQSSYSAIAGALKREAETRDDYLRRCSA